MNPELWQRAKEIYNSVLEGQPGQREVFIAEACAGDEALRKEVESMLDWQEKAGDFIESPALEVAGRAMAEQLTAEESADLTGRRLMHYMIREKIGEGGMGVVYKALDTHLQRPVAIKVLPPEIVADRDRRLRFVQEARAASAPNHPNIITIHDIGQTVSHYEILEKLGGGGRGVVYKAEDTNLNRQVGTEVLPDIFSGDPDKMA